MGVAGKQICRILQFYWQRPDKPTNVSKFLMTSLKWQTPFPALPCPSSLPHARQLSCTWTNPSSYTICISCETTAKQLQQHQLMAVTNVFHLSACVAFCYSIFFCKLPLTPPFPNLRIDFTQTDW